MKNPFNAHPPAFDAEAIHATIQRALASAGLDPQAGAMLDLGQTLRRAAAAAAAGSGAAWHPEPPLGGRPPAGEMPHGLGRFESHRFSNPAGSRAYKLYVPPATGDAPRPMVVMLHGCTQGADDFAAGTRMNRLADAHGFLVLYPEQATQANASRCWNWFKPEDQQRGTGEPSLLAGMVAEVAQRHGADPRRIYVAGLSAGAAMAVVLGQTYPELFAGVGAHSGLPYGSAHDLPSALAAMKGGRSGMPGLKPAPAAAASARGRAAQAVPVIVFHGDRDHTVQHSNGEHIVQQARDAHRALAADGSLRATAHAGVAPGGRRFSRTVHTDAQGQPRIESWTLHGAGHAWSGGHASGSYTDATGPDASAEMVRFFMALPGAGTA